MKASQGADDEELTIEEERAALCIGILCALCVLHLAPVGQQLACGTRSPPQDPAEFHALSEKAIERGGRALATILRRIGAQDSPPQAFDRGRQLAPELACPYRPVRGTLRQILSAAGIELAREGDPSFPELAALAGLASAASLPMPLRGQWASALVQAEASRADEGERSLIDELGTTLDPPAIISAAYGLSGERDLNEFRNSADGHHARAGLARLVGDEMAARFMQPRLNLRNPDGALPDPASAAAMWPRVIAELPDGTPMGALLRAAADASIDMAALLDDPVFLIPVMKRSADGARSAPSGTPLKKRDCLNPSIIRPVRGRVRAWVPWHIWHGGYGKAISEPRCFGLLAAQGNKRSAEPIVGSCSRR